MAVTLINPFEVPEGREDEAVREWEKARDWLAARPGYVSTELHRALSPDARFRLVNVARWESPEAFAAAVGSEEFRRLTADAVREFPHFPALYEVIRE